METAKEKEKEKRRAVPKFGSFKPKPTPAPETGSDTPRSTSQEPRARREGNRREDERRRVDDCRDDERRHDERESGRDRDRERERERDRHTRGERERHRDRNWDRERIRDRSRDHERDRHRHHDGRHSPRTTSSRDKDDSRHAPALSNDLFVIDKHGDPLIVQYGANDRSTVPAYHRFGAGRIIGSPGFLTIHRDTAREQFSIRLPGEGSGSTSAFRDKALVAAANRAVSKRIKPSPDESLPSVAQEDFIPLEPSRKRKRDSHSPYGGPDYRSIYGKARSPSPSSFSPPSSSRSPSPTSGEAFTISATPELTPTQSRVAALSSHLKTHPTDTPAWRELITLQDALFAENRPDSSTFGPTTTTRTADEIRALAELKIGLYQEALEHVANPKEREGLILGMMNAGRKVWDETVLLKKWDEVLAKEGGRFGLWKGRLDFEMGRVAAFSVDGVKGMVVRKLAALGEELLRADANGEGDVEEEVCGQVVYVLLRLTRLLRDAGFGELAVAAWQAVLEMTFCRPAGDLTAEAAVDLFGEFWESEVARIGEEGARGWRRFVEAGEDAADPPESRAERAGEIPQATDPFRAWAAAEQQAAATARMPARTLDEGTEDDPFRVVMFSDIRDFLVWFPSATLARVKPLLADAFLVFCGLPPAGISGETFPALLNDSFVAGKGQGLGSDLGRTEAGSTLDLSRKVPEFGQQGSSMALSPEVLFSGDSWFRYLDKWSDIYSAGDTQVEVSWALRTLGYLVKDCGMEALAEFYLAMEWLNEPAGARKVAKGLLKQYSSNLRLYNAYALVEWANGNAEVSHKVLSSATGLASPSASSDTKLLWNTWAWIHLESGQKEMALARLCSSVDRDLQGSTVSPALLLKARSHLSSIRDYSLSSQQLETAAQYAESLMLLDYPTGEPGSEPASETQGNITAALSTIHAFSHDLKSRNITHTPHHERLLQTAARLLYYHATHGPYRPRYLTSTLQTFLTHFPHNTIFLTLLAWTQPSLTLNDPIRTTSQSLSNNNNDRLSTYRFAIRHESRVGTAHSVRAAFEAALDSPACRGSVELWVAYVRFCCRHKELRGKAREVFYRAVAACPWAKEVYMLAFGPLVDLGLLGGAEMRAVVESMVGKGLRVCADLEGVLERWGRERGG